MKKQVKKQTKQHRNKPNPHLTEVFTKGLSELYARDPSAPGLVISWLPVGEFYVSAVRYDKPYGEGKQVLISFRAPTFDAAIAGLVEEWLDGTKHARALNRAGFKP